MDIAIVVSVVSAIVAFGALFVSALRVQIARTAIRQASLQRSLSLFDLLSQALLEHIDLMYDVLGLDKSVPEKEAKNVAYLVLDCCQLFYGEIYHDDFNKMAETLKRNSTFLNRIFANEANQKRWVTLKNLCYGDVDSSFVKAVDDLIQFEISKRAKDKTTSLK